MKGIHLVLIVLFGVAAFIFWRMLRRPQWQGGYPGRAAAGYEGLPLDLEGLLGDTKGSTSQKRGSIPGLVDKCHQAFNLGSAAVGSYYTKGKVNANTLAKGGKLNPMYWYCDVGGFVGKAAKPLVKAVGAAGKAIGKGTVTAVKETAKVVKTGALVAGKEIKAITKSPTALVKSTPKLALAPIVAPTQVVTKVASKVAGAKVGKAVTIAAAPVVVPTKVAAKAVTTGAKVAGKAAGKVASGAKSVAKKLKFW
jgi:hypothetical protein